MATTYPGTIQTFTDPSGTSPLATGPDHAQLHTDINDTLEAVQTVMGTTAGTAVLKNLTAGQFVVSESGTATLTNKTLTSPKINEDVVLTANSTTLNNLANKNYIINGNFDVWQRGTSFTNPANIVYVSDRWRTLRTDDAQVDIKQTADAPTASEAGGFSSYCLHIDITTADSSIAAGQFYGIMQKLEGNAIQNFGFGKAGTRYVTLSFWVKATKTGTYCVSFRNSAGDRSYVSEYTVSSSNTWEKKTITIAVDTSGTWLYDTGAGLQIAWMLASGSTFHTTADSWAAGNYLASSNQVNALDNASNDFKLARVKLEQGSTATAFVPLKFEEELRACQRYYWKSFAYEVAPAQNTASRLGSIGYRAQIASTTAGNAVMVRFPVQMRISPSSITYYNPNAANAKWRNQSGGTDSADATTSGNISQGGFLALNAQVAGDGAGNIIDVHATAEAEL